MVKKTEAELDTLATPTDEMQGSLKALAEAVARETAKDAGEDSDLPELNTPEQIEDFALQDDYALNPQYIELVIDAADRNDGMRLRELLDALHPADVADLMGFLSEDYREQVIPWIPADALADILSELDEGIREEVVETLRPVDLAEVLQELDSDDAAAVFEDMEADQQKAVLAAMDPEDREAMVTSLAFEEETAGRLMQREVVAAPDFWDVGHTIDHMRAHAADLPELFFDVYVISPTHKPIGGLPVSLLMRSPRDVKLSAIMEPVTEIEVGMDQEEIAYIFEKYHLISAPVVDAGGRLVGQITVDDIVNIIQEENREDILALAGVSDDEGRDSTVFDVVRSRLPWLCVNLLTAFMASSLISVFSGEIEKLVALAVLMPMVASIGGNSGTQALTVSVRALSSRELTTANALRTVWRELRVGWFNGAVIAAILGVVAGVVFSSPMLGITIALAVMINLTAAALAGTLVPLTLSKLDRDPAAASPIFVTMVTDCVGFFSFLGLAAIILL
ncbi:magnesium transporter [Asticcacaulis sp. BYS171W]|uniref:Magnesium transporter MgtE n=1 Tax=Asticcacaulis aquaticus TaxID=2984212 RepID=A0ABT5HV27_9CAUL|nr:magnesium transporter [Asticcacaulis aquaticus]MDC7683920.1 magnesium transporter [Asticcacaulis aquaticus]